ncbi:MAG: hypothetical protein WC223_10845 [Bacteroidales bacterium]|jgi:hypothetical protein
METLMSTTRITEHDRTPNGLYFWKIEQRTEKDGWIPTAYVHRVYDQGLKKYVYSARDSVGNQIYSDIHDLKTLKSKFKEDRKTLVELAKMAQMSRIPKQQNKAQDKAIANPKGAERLNAIKNVREKKDEKSKSQQISKQEQKEKNIRTEKELDAKNIEKYNDSELLKEESNQKTNDYKEVRTPDNRDIEKQDNEVSEREAELNDIRNNDNDDLEQENEQDYEMEI